MSLTAFIFPLGLGVLRIAWPFEDTESDPRALLDSRRRRHEELIAGSTNVGSRCHSIASACSDFCGSDAWVALTDQNRPFDYVFSVWKVIHDPTRTDAAVDQLEAALLTPSRFGVTDTSWDPRAPSARPDFYETGVFEDLDPNPGVRCKMSWSSIVVVTERFDESADIVSALEVRTQGLWLASHRISRFWARGGTARMSDIDLMSVLYDRAAQTLLSLEDPMTNERIVALHNGVVLTSDIRQKVADARGALDTLAAFGTRARGGATRQVRDRSDFVAHLDCWSTAVARCNHRPMVRMAEDRSGRVFDRADAGTTTWPYCEETVAFKAFPRSPVANKGRGRETSGRAAYCNELPSWPSQFTRCFGLGTL